MLFKIVWSMYSDKKMECYKAFSQMTPEDDKNDTGKHITIIGRWHSVGGGTGVCICSTNDIEALTAWLVNWAEMCDIDVEPVIDDETLRPILKEKLNKTFFGNMVKVECCC